MNQKELKTAFSLSPAHAAQHILVDLVGLFGVEGAKEVAKCINAQSSFIYD